MTSHELGEELRKVWEDQFAFNTLFRKPPTTVAEMAKQTRDFVLYTEDELHELLRVFKWKEHRRGGAKENLGHMEDELADIFKCAMSLFQICGMTPEKMIDVYWRKSAVVRQRYHEEWVNKVTGPCAVVDIDNVLCDYIGGMCAWLRTHPRFNVIPSPLWQQMLERVEEIEAIGSHINGEALGIPEAAWQELKHEFRVTGAKRHLPAFVDAQRFLQQIRERGYQIVLLTSRPIDRYPNIQTDTLLWLHEKQLPFDFLWWSYDKSERILDSGFRDQVKFAVDDDERHLAGFAKLGVPCFLLKREKQATWVESEEIALVRTLDDILDVVI